MYADLNCRYLDAFHASLRPANGLVEGVVCAKLKHVREICLVLVYVSCDLSADIFCISQCFLQTVPHHVQRAPCQDDRQKKTVIHFPRETGLLPIVTYSQTKSNDEFLRILIREN